MSSFSASDTEAPLCGVSPPISVLPRHLQVPPRSVLQPFRVDVCWPCGSNTSCTAVCSPELKSTLDAKGVVLFSTGEQIEVDVMKSTCLTCNTSYIYDGAEDNLLVMERSAKNGHKYILLDEHWVASMGREFFLSKGSFSDTYQIWQRNRALIPSRFDGHDEVYISKTKFIEYNWKYLTHLIAPNLPKEAMTCSTCGSRPNAIVFDGIALGLLQTLVKKQFHTVHRNQLRFADKVRISV